ncbi:hypothetical protein B8V81_4479 [Paenibacillus pasadenensis]|uniref:Uncharacterized protein n=1 Tax=Paenibacillus pasadenensis TaxID=217090 RepID=A0A2N5N6T7_9BACL|nr:hypothetical protein [Paenibacillus pasadenensis]PLT46048.1 hypothetical protein B8V81_4479 [Paenibacillus pasadenensis]
MNVPHNRAGAVRRARGRIAGVLGAALLALALAGCSTGSSSVFDTSGGSSSGASAAGQSAAADTSVVPWDYRVAEAEVGDLIGGDMTILPDNQLMANDSQYATGDKIFTLQYMTANLKENSEGKASVSLSAWTPIKSYRAKAEADADLERLKLRLKTKVDLVGVYKTELDGKSRQFAVLELPSGQVVKQPIDEDRYASLKSAKQADVILEEIHDFSEYDLAYSKFRGWAAS